MDVAKFSVKNPILVNLLMIGLFVFGTIALLRMPTELNPDINFNWIIISVPYPGASPTEIENQIVDPIETEISDVDKIKEILSNASEGMAVIFIKLEDVSDTRFREILNDVKSEVDKADLPDDAEDPVIDDFSSGEFLPVIDINMSFSIPEANALKIADDLEEDLKDVDGVGKVQVSGYADREIWVEIDPEKLNTYNLTLEDVFMAIRTRNLNVPGGNISIGKTEYLIRSIGEYKDVDEISNTIVRSNSNGRNIKVRDLAKVSNRRKELVILSRSNGNKSISFSISKKSEANSLEIIDKIKQLVESYKTRVPDGVKFGYFNDNSVYINRVIGILKNNAISGMILIAFILYFFLGKSNALLASLGIPISFFITFIFMFITGETVNGSSLFALVMVLGIIVDDAIIVIENCHRYRLMGYNSHDSAIMGTREVVMPIISSIATNIAAFLPLMLLPGIMGKFMRIIPLIFSLALVASLFEAFFLLPSHYADWTSKSKSYKQGEKKFFIVLRKFYTKLLFKVLRLRYVVMSVMTIVFLVSIELIGFVGIEMFPDEDFDQFTCLLKFPEGTSLEETNRIMKQYEKIALELPQKHVVDVITNVGLYQDDAEWITAKNVGQIKVQLVPQENRNIETAHYMEQMRSQTANIPGATSVQYLLIKGGPPVGKPISVRVQGKYLDEIKKVALELQDSIKLINGALEVTDDFPPGKKEVDIIVDEDKAALYGFSAQYVAMNIRYAFDGVEATEYRDGDEEIDVILKYQEENRSALNDILNLKLTNTRSQTVALRDMVEFKIKRGPTTIRRFKQKRSIMVTGEIDKNKTKMDVVNREMEQIFKKLEAKYPGISFKVGGAFDEFMDAFNDMVPLFTISMIIIFGILAVQFNSYTQPLVIMATVPFAFVGSMIGLIFTGNPFSFASLYGFVALAGIVVNDAIVLISFFNRKRNIENLKVYNIWKSIIDAGRLRLRPIILTSMTTIFGLMPMALGIGGQSSMWAPLANVILFGLLVATILTLFVIPSLLAILDDIKKVRKRARLKH